MSGLRREEAAPAALAFVAVVGPARAGGGFTAATWGLTAVALAAVALACLYARPLRPGPLELVAVGALALFAGWTALSLLWSPSTPLTVAELERLLVPLTALVAGLAAVRAGTAWALGLGVAAAAAVLGAASLVAGADRPLGYANALALLCVLGILLALGGARELRRAHVLVAAGLLAGMLALAVAATESRGAWAALLGGAAVGLALRLPRPGVAVVLTLVVATAAIGLVAERGSPQRAAYWRVTAGEVAREPLLGSGAGTWRRTWLAHRDVDSVAANAHSLYLETLSELGPVGPALLLVALLVPLVGAVRAREERFVRPLASAYAAFLLHLGIDWDWQIAAVQVAGVLLAAALLASARAHAGRRREVPRLPALAACVAVTVAGVAVWAGGALQNAADEHLRAAAWADAERDARRARRLAPWASEPWRQLGQAQLGRGDAAAAAASFRRALERDPGDVEVWRLLAQVGSSAELRHAVTRVAQLDPLGPRPARGLSG